MSKILYHPAYRPPSTWRSRARSKWICVKMLTVIRLYRVYLRITEVWA